MRSNVALVCLSLVVAFAACSTEKLVAHAPKLNIDVYTAGQSYVAFDNTVSSIDLGEVPVSGTKWAIFQLSNPTQVPLKIDAVYATTSVGVRWQEAHWLDLELLQKDAANNPRVLEKPFDTSAAGRKFYDCTLEHALCQVTAPSCSGGQVPAVYNGCGVECIEPSATIENKTTWGCTTEIPAFGVYLMGIAYQPLETGDHSVTVELHSNAATASIKSVSVTGKAVFTGGPDLEVSYNRGAYNGPAAEDCATEGCVIPNQNALDFGNIGLGGTGTAMLLIKNAAQCQAFLGVDPCTLCALTIDKDPAVYNIGIGFKAGTNNDGVFAFGSSTRVPFDLLQRNVNLDDSGRPICPDAINPSRAAEGVVSLPIVFSAPMTEGAYQTTLVIESTDPAKPVLEIPIVAYSRNAPLAVAKLRDIDPLNPGAPHSDPANIQPLNRVYLDGRLSYDPEVCPACGSPSDPSCISQRAASANGKCGIGSYAWTVVEYPVGTDPGMFQHQGADSALYSFWLPLAGHYVVALTVLNDAGIASGDTTDSKVDFDVIPGSRIHVQLTWDDPTNDQDLHLMKLPDAAELCDQPWDCYFANKTPVWFSNDAEAEGSNPRLDIDDTNGLGPENTNIDDPEPGTYRVAIHYWRGTAATRNTVRIFLNGLQVAEYRRTLNNAHKWLVADIKWNENGTGVLIPYPPDVDGQVGAVSSFPTSSCGGFGI
jgi:hypothetical protein